MPRKSERPNWAAIIVGGLVVILLLVVVVLICIVQLNKKVDAHDEATPPPPAPPSPPPPVNGAECDWCDDLTDRLPAVLQSSNKKRAHHCTDLSQSDFAAGTFIADQADTCYVLTEDIVFHPNPGGDFRADQAPYAGDPTFVLDFPTAFLVRAPGVALDLGGHEIRQSRVHALEQRFFAVIELTTPFIDGQGPADFVDSEPTPASGFSLRNGVIGLSSHHAIHGNGAWTVLIEDLIIREYEVAAIHLNGMHDVVLRRVNAQGTSTTVPVLGTYSSARFLIPFVNKALGMAGAPQQAAKNNLLAKKAHLLTLMGQVRSDVDILGYVNKNTHPEAHALFANPSSFPDGSASYGFVLHAHGVAVNGFRCDRSDSSNDEMHHILIEDCEVIHTTGDVLEVPALQEASTSKLQRGPAGDLLRIADIVMPGGGYHATALADTKAALQLLVMALGNPAGFGTLAVHQDVLLWMAGDNARLANIVSNGDFHYKRNGDTMFHVQKGVLGIRVGGGHHIAIRRTLVDGVLNVGDPANMSPLPGETEDDAYWTGPEDGGHPGAAPQSGYGGADSVGIGIAASSNVILDAVTVRNVHSQAGWATGVYVFNDAAAVHIHDLSVFGVTAHTTNMSSIHIVGPKNPRAVGVAVTTDAEEPTYSGSLDIQGVVTGKVGTACNTIHENSHIDKCTPPENFYTL